MWDNSEIWYIWSQTTLKFDNLKVWQLWSLTTLTILKPEKFLLGWLVRDIFTDSLQKLQIYTSAWNANVFLRLPAQFRLGSLNLKFECDGCIWNVYLKSEFESTTWLLSLHLKSEPEVWIWSLKCEHEVWIWSLSLKSASKVWM